MASIRIQGLSKRYERGERPALDRLDLTIEDGEFLVLVGPSGCGKSTALRIIAGLEEATAGTVHLGDKDVTDVPPQQRDVAMVFQGYALYPHLSVRDNMGFPLKMRGLKKSARNEKVEEIAKVVGLSDKLERLPSALSGGERQRVAMGRAIVREPQVFLFDEPLSNLDAKLRGELRVELVQLVKRLGVTAIYVTHDQAEAMTMGDRVAVLDGGQLQQVASPRDVYERPTNTFVASFVGTPPMNMLRVRVEDDVVFVESDDRAEATDEPAIAASSALDGDGAGVWESIVAAAGDEGHVLLGFRPEHASLVAGTDASVRVHAEVVALEALGPETLVFLTSAAGELRVRVRGFDAPPVGAKVRVCVSPSDLLWFAADGLSLGSHAAS